MPKDNRNKKGNEGVKGNERGNEGVKSLSLTY